LFFKSNKIGTIIDLSYTDNDITNYNLNLNLVKANKRYDDIYVEKLDDDIFSRDVKNENISSSLKSNSNNNLSSISSDINDISLNKVYILLNSENNNKNRIICLGVDNKISILFFDNGISIDIINEMNPVELSDPDKKYEINYIIENTLDKLIREDVNLLCLQL